MHDGQPLDFYQATPVNAAEFIAGQLYGLTGRRIPTETGTIRTAQEFTTIEPEMPVMFEVGSMPPRVNNFLAVRSVVNIVNELFAAPASPPEVLEAR